MTSATPHHVVIGAGPGGLTAAFSLTCAGQRCTVIEREAQPGGLARTIWRGPFGFDIGGHRFYTKSAEIQTLWREILGDDFRPVKRLSRIYHNGKFFDYPLKPWNALAGLGPFTSGAVMVSYIYRKVRPLPAEDTFEQFVINRFGDRLYNLFFKGYTEKVWGVSCDQIQADWAAQRIQELSLASALKNALTGASAAGPKSLVEQFDYPRLGPGLLWERMTSRVEAQGGRVKFGQEICTIHHDGNGRVMTVEHRAVNSGQSPGEHPVGSGHVFSSMPLQALLLCMNPPPPPQVVAAARALRYRDFLTVNLCLNKSPAFPDQWIYIHSPDVRVGRIQNFANWSADLAPPGGAGVGMEYFCSEGDELWSMNDADLVDMAVADLGRLGLVRARATLVDSFVVRVKKAYPLYDADFRNHLGIIREWLGGFTNLHPLGRNGLHRYNNQDHSMLTAFRAVENAINGARNDVWAVNADAEYGELDN